MISTVRLSLRKTTIWSGGGGGGGAIGTTTGGATTTTGLAAGAAGLAATGAAGRRDAPYSSDTYLPGVLSTPSSLELRNISWMRPSPLASVRVSASAGVASKVTVVTETGVPRASACMACPA